VAIAAKTNQKVPRDIELGTFYAKQKRKKLFNSSSFKNGYLKSNSPL